MGLAETPPYHIHFVLSDVILEPIPRDPVAVGMNEEILGQLLNHRACSQGKMHNIICLLLTSLSHMLWSLLQRRLTKCYKNLIQNRGPFKQTINITYFQYYHILIIILAYIYAKFPEFSTNASQQRLKNAYLFIQIISSR